MQWALRSVREPFAGQQRITIPLSGGPPPAGCGRDLTFLLDLMWVERPVERGQVEITSVVGLIARDPESLGQEASYSLLLLLTSPALGTGQRADSPRMALDLEAALFAVHQRAQ